MPLQCYAEVTGDRGCCGDSVPPACVAGRWECPRSSLVSTDCREFRPACGDGPIPPPPPPPEDCAGLDETTCLGTTECVPLYHDACCSDCEAGGFCADCTDPQFFECVDRAQGCGPTGPLCGFVSEAQCANDPSICDGDRPNASGRCFDPGCVELEDTPRCVFLTAESCTASCRMVEPCEVPGTSEADGFCYTGRCFTSPICAP